ncbi:MAG: hypothetical protein AB7I27_03495 [Bacteriovoracaceae bacterium]
MKNLKLIPLVLVSFLNSSYAQTGEYVGSSYKEILQIISNKAEGPIDSKYKDEYETYQRGELPHYEINRGNFFEAGTNLILEAAKRTTTQKFDWYPRITKLVHSNGICVSGKWNITEESGYTGYFEKGKSALFIGRVSVALSDTEKGFLRGFGLAGKIFPTLDPNEVVKTANFFTADDLGGTSINHFTETALTNEPALSFRFTLVKLLLAINSAFKQADSNPGFRPLYPISELATSPSQKIVTPHWMKLEPDTNTAKVNEADFRNELNFSKYYQDGMKINIYVSETTPSRLSTQGWKKIGYIQLENSFVSYGCDRQLHFAHPKLK